MATYPTYGPTAPFGEPPRVRPENETAWPTSLGFSSRPGRRGDTGAAVAALARLLAKDNTGFQTFSDAPGRPSGYFSPAPEYDDSLLPNEGAGGLGRGISGAGGEIGDALSDRRKAGSSPSLSDARTGYDAYQKATGGQTSTDWLSNLFGFGGGPDYMGGSGPAPGSFRGAQEVGMADSGGGSWLDSITSLFGGGGAAGGATGLGEGATMTSIYGLPEAGSASLAGTTGGSSGIGSGFLGGGGSGAAGLAAFWPLALFAAGMAGSLYLANEHDEDLDDYRSQFSAEELKRMREEERQRFLRERETRTGIYADMGDQGE